MGDGNHDASIRSHLVLAFVARRRIPFRPYKLPRQARAVATVEAVLKAAARILGRPPRAQRFVVNEQVIAEHLTAALEDLNPDALRVTVSQVAKAHGMSSIAESTGLGRESLYKALTSGAKPRYDTVLKVLRGLSVKLSVTADRTAVHTAVCFWQDQLQ